MMNMTNVYPDTMFNDSLSDILLFNETHQYLFNNTRTRSGLTALKLFVGSVYALFIICTIVGNSLVICAVLRYRRLRHKTNYIILSLAVTDMTVAILVMPFSLIYDVTGEWHFGWILCYFWRSCDVMCCTASILHICCIALDRFWAIKDPFKYKKKMTKRTLGGMITGTWTLSVAISFVPIYLGWFTNDPTGLYIDDGYCDLAVNRIYAVLSSATSFYGPFLLMSLAYAYILRIARAQAERMNKQNAATWTPQASDKGKAMKKMAREHKAVHTLGTIMGVFLVSWLPFFLMYVIMPFCSTCSLSLTALSLITWLGYLNSALNPLIYAFLNSDFRRAFKYTISCGRCGRRSDSYVSNCNKLRQHHSLQDDPLPATRMNRRLSTSLPSLAAEKQLRTYARNCTIDFAKEV